MRMDPDERTKRDEIMQLIRKGSLGGMSVSRDPAGSKQSTAMSLCESCTKTFFGYIGAVCLQMLIFPWFGYEARWQDAFAMTTVFAAYSILLGYLLRRCFEEIRVRLARLTLLQTPPV